MPPPRRIISKNAHLLQFPDVPVLLPDGVDQSAPRPVVGDLVELVHLLAVLGERAGVRELA